MRGTSIALIFALAAAMPATARTPDRPPTAAERTEIEKVLRANGFTSWEDIELDDGRWEVDNARHKDNRVYDLELDPKTLKIVDRDLED